MKTRTIAFLGIAASLSLGGFGIAACSSDNTASSGGLPTLDSGGQDSTTNKDSSSGSDTGTGTDTGGGSDGGGITDANTGDCKGPPAIPFAEDGSTGPYCPFTAAAAADAGKHCATGETCCHPNNTSPETCAASATACGVPEGGLTYGCDTPEQCGTGKVCCMNGSILTDQTCGYLYASKSTYTQCEQGTACAAGEIVICSQNSDCPSGQTCTSFKGKGGHDLGYCKQ